MQVYHLLSTKFFKEGISTQLIEIEALHNLHECFWMCLPSLEQSNINRTSRPPQQRTPAKETVRLWDAVQRWGQSELRCNPPLVQKNGSVHGILKGFNEIYLTTDIGSVEE